MNDIITSPWTTEEARLLNVWQAAGHVHPFTCPNDGATLTATPDGWTCPECKYTQTWAHRHMLKLPPNPLGQEWVSRVTNAAEPLSDAEVESLDPGIRDLVVQLRAAGYETTDSGDGVSKSKDWYESGEAIPYPHVVIHIPDHRILVEFSNDLHNWLYDHGYTKFTVESSYVVGESAHAMVRPLHSQMPIEHLRAMSRP